MSAENPATSASFEDFLKKIRPRLKRIVAYYRIPPADAEDVLQQSLLALIYNWERVQDPQAWMFGTLKRHCLMYWRKHRRQLYSAVDATLLEGLSRPVAPAQPHDALLADLRDALGRIPSRCRSLLEMRFQMGYEAPEIARRLGYRNSSIGKITTRCLAALSREIVAARVAP